MINTNVPVVSDATNKKGDKLDSIISGLFGLAGLREQRKAAEANVQQAQIMATVPLPQNVGAVPFDPRTWSMPEAMQKAGFTGGTMVMIVGALGLVGLVAYLVGKK